MTRRQWALVAVLVLINYIIFASLATVVLTERARYTAPTRTPLPTFTPLPPATTVVLPSATPSATPTRTLTPTHTPVIPTETATAVPPTKVPTRPSVTVNVSLRVRSGPGVDYPQIGSLPAGTTVDVTGRNTDGSWWQIVYPDATGGKGWISAKPEYATARDTDNVPLVESQQPTPEPAPRPTGPQETVPEPSPQPTGPQETTPTPEPQPNWQFEPTGFEGQWNAGLAQIRGKVVDSGGQPVKGVFMQAKCGGTVMASNPSGTNLYAANEPYEAGAFDIILSSPLSPSSMCNWEVRIVQASSYEEAKNSGAPALSDTAYCDLEWEVASVCFTRWRKNW